MAGRPPPDNENKPAWKAEQESKALMPAERAALKTKKEVHGELERWTKRLENFYNGDTKQVERFKSIVLDALNNERIATCTPETIIQSAMNAAKLDLEINTPLQEAFLVPYKDRATLQIGYHGWIKVAKDRGGVKSASAEVVYSSDKFTWDTARGLISHEGHYGRKKPEGELVCAYARLVLPDGTEIFELVPGWQILQIRDASLRRSGNRENVWDGPNEHRMWRKTALAFAARQHIHSPRIREAQIMDSAFEGVTLDVESTPVRDDPQPPSVRRWAGVEETPPPAKEEPPPIDVEPEPEVKEQPKQKAKPEPKQEAPKETKPAEKKGRPRAKIEADFWRLADEAGLSETEAMTQATAINPALSGGFEALDDVEVEAINEAFKQLAKERKK